MKCVDEFVYKSLEKRDGGKFTNDKGQEIEYSSSYVLKVDEMTEKGATERKFKFPTKNTELYNNLKDLKIYTRITLEFDVDLYGSQARVTPARLVEVN